MYKENNDIDISGIALFSASFLAAIVLWIYPSLLLYEKLSINVSKILLIFSIVGSGLLPMEEEQKTITSDLSMGAGFIGIFLAWIKSTNNIETYYLLFITRIIFFIVLIIGIYGMTSGIAKQVNNIHKRTKQRQKQETPKKESKKITIKESVEFIFKLIGAIASLATIYQIAITS